ncbi:uncharacterized protein LOC132743391 [Ruditapes philippinarum]|uniref:uncharacterized protein LOC132743391 n=1 Tax=Ruditapes philippinarum TaxID=129788 RepID=UPI00295B5696|nr:uncharacterized protein LOC132743391 [Ruditapes philippinarum]XP_060587891.1 uncharacterized protein LOC132743391 [Ruditapes philippinarum]XP_060587892.1 uncharacterized protein LOC132743391 [Ruditapes philippinarum]
MSRHRKELEVRFIRYTQDEIHDTFDDGTRLRDTLDNLHHKRYDVDKIPKITVVKRDEVYFSLDNRRLWVFQQYANYLKEKENVLLKVPVIFGTSDCLETRGMTTTTEGEDIKLRHQGATKTFPNIKYISLSKICYSTDKLFRLTRSGGLDQRSTIEEEFERFSSTKPFKIPVLKVVQRRGKLYALDNRKLWLVKKWFQKIFDFVNTEEQKSSFQKNIVDSSSRPNKESEVNSKELEGAVASSNSTNYEEINDVIKVEMRPYGELPANFLIENEGLSVTLVQGEPRIRRSHYRRLSIDHDSVDVENISDPINDSSDSEQ